MTTMTTKGMTILSMTAAAFVTLVGGSTAARADCIAPESCLCLHTTPTAAVLMTIESLEVMQGDSAQDEGLYASMRIDDIAPDGAGKDFVVDDLVAVRIGPSESEAYWPQVGTRLLGYSFSGQGNQLEPYTQLQPDGSFYCHTTAANVPAAEALEALASPSCLDRFPILPEGECDDQGGCSVTGVRGNGDADPAALLLIAAVALGLSRRRRHAEILLRRPRA